MLLEVLLVCSLEETPYSGELSHVEEQATHQQQMLPNFLLLCINKIEALILSLPMTTMIIRMRILIFLLQRKWKPRYLMSWIVAGLLVRLARK
jgi:hypothetical protein